MMRIILAAIFAFSSSFLPRIPFCSNFFLKCQLMKFEKGIGVSKSVLVGSLGDLGLIGNSESGYRCEETGLSKLIEENKEEKRFGYLDQC